MPSAAARRASHARAALAEEVPLIPVAWGELVDKITILELKAERIADAGKRANVAEELEVLRAACNRYGPLAASAVPLMASLRAVNAALWDVEDGLRALEAEGDFSERFLSLARSVYRYNDERAALKRRINIATGSALLEEKSYTAWQR